MSKTNQMLGNQTYSDVNSLLDLNHLVSVNNFFNTVYFIYQVFNNVF